MLKKFFALFFACFFVFWVVMPATAGTPLTTMYFSLTLPDSWRVIEGPKKTRDLVDVLVGTSDHSCSAQIRVGSVKPGMAEIGAREYAKQLNGTKPVARNGQLEFAFEQKGVKGICIFREDPLAKLLMIVIISGKPQLADFIYQMRGPYKTLYPRPVN